MRNGRRCARVFALLGAEAGRTVGDSPHASDRLWETKWLRQCYGLGFIQGPSVQVMSLRRIDRGRFSARVAHGRGGLYRRFRRFRSHLQFWCLRRTDRGGIHAGRVVTSALFSITGLIFYALGSLTGHLSDRLGPRIVVSAGAGLVGAGLVSTAFIEQIWGGHLTYGIGVGLGAACAYVPTLAIVGGWFTRRRNAALGIAAAGTGCDMLVVPPMIATLIEHFGWRHADMILGVGCALLLTICAACRRVRRLRLQSGLPVSCRALSGVRDALCLVGPRDRRPLVPFVFLPAFALDLGVGQVMAAALISVLGGMSVFGRLGLGFLGDRVGTLRLFKVATFAMGVSYVMWLVASAYGWLWRSPPSLGWATVCELRLCRSF